MPELKKKLLGIKFEYSLEPRTTDANSQGARAKATVHFSKEYSRILRTVAVSKRKRRITVGGQSFLRPLMPQVFTDVHGVDSDAFWPFSKSGSEGVPLVIEGSPESVRAGVLALRNACEAIVSLWASEGEQTVYLIQVHEDAPENADEDEEEDEEYADEEDD